jgi:DNA-binding protein H-NS
MAINLDALSPAELQALIKSAEAQMGAARKNHVQETRTKIDAILANTGLTLDEVYPKRGGKGAKSPKAAVAPKYRNPDNAAQTWSGRGKRPLWFVDALKKRGVTAESLLIQGATKASPAKKAPAKAAKKAPAKKKTHAKK